MARYTGPKNRLARREGLDLGMKTPGSKSHAVLQRRLNVPPGQHGNKGRRKISSFGTQLREKQKARRMFGILEKQFRKYFDAALKVKGNTGVALLQQLESRLDNMVYRLAFVPTRAAARQLVGHGHVLVNNKKLSIPSYQVQIDDVITIKPKSLELPVVKKTLEDKGIQIPVWMQRQGAIGKMLRLPERTEMESSINEQLIVEYYSR